MRSSVCVLLTGLLLAGGCGKSASETATYVSDPERDELSKFALTEEQVNTVRRGMAAEVKLKGVPLEDALLVPSFKQAWSIAGIAIATLEAEKAGAKNGQENPPTSGSADRSQSKSTPPLVDAGSGWPVVQGFVIAPCGTSVSAGRWIYSAGGTGTVNGLPDLQRLNVVRPKAGTLFFSVAVQFRNSGKDPAAVPLLELLDLDDGHRYEMFPVSDPVGDLLVTRSTLVQPGSERVERVAVFQIEQNLADRPYALLVRNQPSDKPTRGIRLLKPQIQYASRQVAGPGEAASGAGGGGSLEDTGSQKEGWKTIHGFRICTDSAGAVAGDWEYIAKGIQWEKNAWNGDQPDYSAGLIIVVLNIANKGKRTATVPALELLDIDDGSRYETELYDYDSYLQPFTRLNPNTSLSFKMAPFRVGHGQRSHAFALLVRAHAAGEPIGGILLTSGGKPMPGSDTLK